MGKTFGVAMLVAALVAFSCVPSGAQEMVEDTVSGQVQAAQADLALYQEHLVRAQKAGKGLEGQLALVRYQRDIARQEAAKAKTEADDYRQAGILGLAAQQERDAIKVQLQEAQEQVGDMKTAVAYMLVFLVMATAVFVALTRRAPALRIEPLPSERAKATKDLSLRV